MVKRRFHLCTVLMFLAVLGESRAEPITEESGGLERFGFGLYGGPSLAWYSGADANSDVYTSSSRVGFAVGAFSRIMLTSWLAFQPELAFSSKGTAYELTPIMESGEVLLSYLSASALAHVAAYRYSGLEAYLLTGIDIGFLLSCTREALGDIGNCKRNSETVDLSLPVGAGISANLPWPGQVMLEIRYEHGLISVDDTEFQADYKNRSVLFSIGYSHHLGAQ